MEFPRNDLIATVLPGLKLRDDGGDGMPVMQGHFAVFNEPTEIDSWDGPFIEEIAPGAFTKTIRENRDAIKVLFNHGFDPQIGDKPLGRIKELREDDIGALYRVQLLDAPYVRDELLPGLREGLYGASFRFSVTKQETDLESEDLPKRTIKEVRLYEFGPVTFPAYQAATAGVRAKFRLTRSTVSTAAGMSTATEPEAKPDLTTSLQQINERRQRFGLEPTERKSDADEHDQEPSRAA